MAKSRLAQVLTSAGIKKEKLAAAPSGGNEHTDALLKKTQAATEKLLKQSQEASAKLSEAAKAGGPSARDVQRRQWYQLRRL